VIPQHHTHALVSCQRAVVSSQSSVLSH